MSEKEERNIDIEKKKGKNKRMKMRERIMHRKNESNINRIKQKGWVMVGIGSEPIRY